MSGATRVEKDPLGALEVPSSALYGVQTLRAVQNFPISGQRPLPMFVTAVVWIKKAAALTHKKTKRLEATLADAIVQAADEVLANRANEILGAARGTYAPVHPNDHVNMAQSTNDVIPTAIRLGALALASDLDASLVILRDALLEKGRAFDGILKSGRTHLQDAMPIRLGQEFHAYGETVERNRRRIVRACDDLSDLGIGGTAVGTGVNAEARYPALMVKSLRDITGLALREGTDRVQLMQSMGDAAALSGQLRTFATDLAKISSDLRLLASGPRTALDEIRLPAVQPGSSIMPGKVNPSIPEMVNQVCCQVIGNDACIAMAASEGQLELNVMMPVIAHNLFLALGILANAVRVLAEKCVMGIEANAAMCEYWVERSAALATALAPRIGYARAAELSKQSVQENVLIRELVHREHVLEDALIEETLDLRRLTDIGVPGGTHGPSSAG